MIKLNKVLIIIFVLVLCLIPNIQYTYNEVTDSFLYPRIAISKVSLDSNMIATSINVNQYSNLPSNAIGLAETPLLTALLVIISQITDLSLKIIQFMPINGIMLIFISFALANKILKSVFYALIFVIYISYEPVVHGLAFSVFTHGWALSLYYIFLIIYMRVFDLKHKQLNVILLIILFISALLFYYTLEMYMIVFALSANLLIAFEIYQNKDKHSAKKHTYHLALVFIVIFMTFDKIFYNVIQTSISDSNELRGTITSYINTVANIMYPSTINNTPIVNEYIYTFVSSKNEMVLNNISILLYLLIVIPILYLIATQIIYTFKTKKIRFNNNFVIFQWAIIATAIADLISYLSIGYMSFKYVLYIFPLITLSALNLIRLNKRIKTSFIIIFIALVIIKFLLWNTCYIDENYDRGYTTITPSSEWFFDKVPSGEHEIVTDLVTSGKLSVESTYNKHKIELILFNSRIIESLIKADTKPHIYDYMVLNYNSLKYPTKGGDWTSYTPLKPYMSIINNNTNYNLIYDDSHYIFYNKLK